jgi:effector-binding domain-containing protein
MTVEFAFRNVPAYRVAYVTWSGPWNEKKIRQKFESVAKWAKAHDLRTGEWIFREPGSRRWETGLRVYGKATSSGGVRLKTLPKSRVAYVVFDPDVVSPSVCYHGLTDWLRWRKKEHTIKSVRSYREVYAGNPWTDPKVWARTEIQFVVS